MADAPLALPITCQTRTFMRFIAIVCLLAASALGAADATKPSGIHVDVDQLDRDRVLKAADQYLAEKPITITASRSPRSTGGPHDYFSEGDYWWPDPKNPDGPYIQRDGESNPDNFNDHRLALIRMSIQVPALVAAFKLTGDRKYAD